VEAKAPNIKNKKNFANLLMCTEARQKVLEYVNLCMISALGAWRHCSELIFGPHLVYRDKYTS